MGIFEKIDEAIQTNLAELRKPGVFTVRPGYKIKAGWITTQPAIVTTVDRKIANIRPEEAVPAEVGGYPTDVRQATQLQRLRQVNPQMHATISATARPEYDQPEFPLERDVITGQLLEKAAPHGIVAAMAKKPKVDYEPPMGASLEKVTAPMSIICHASPDAGWIELKKFLQSVKNQLTVGMYDFTSAHILETLEEVFKGTQKLSLVLDHPPKNHTADQTDEETEQSLASNLQNRLEFAWAAEARDPKVSKGIFPSAYHIKVAVKDHESFWLSSGNWNNSNQPDIDPFGPTPPKDVTAIAMKSDRDWHVIVEQPGLAKTFEAYLENDLQQAMQWQISAAKVAALPSEAAAPSPEMPIQGKKPPAKYFAPFPITNETITIQPLLTPDQGAGNYAQNILELIRSASQRLYIQTQYIHSPKSGEDDGFKALIDTVAEKMTSGLDVRLILSKYEATGGWLEKLQEAGLDMSKVRIQNGVHNKGFIADSKVVALGSQNWSGDGVLRNRDASLIIYHEGAAQYFEKIFIHDWEVLARQKLTV
jgi:hypothetical protein